MMDSYQRQSALVVSSRSAPISVGCSCCMETKNVALISFIIQVSFVCISILQLSLNFWMATGEETQIYKEQPPVLRPVLR